MRSVAIANEIYKNLHEKNYDVYIEHRDIKEDVHKGDKNYDNGVFDEAWYKN